MSEFYTVPMVAAKTNESYIVPTTTQGSIFSRHSSKSHKSHKEHKDSHKDSHEEESKEPTEKRGLKKILKFFKGNKN